MAFSTLKDLIGKKPVPEGVKGKILRSIFKFLSLAKDHFKDKLLAVIVFGSAIQPDRPFFEDSDIDFIVLYDEGRSIVWSFEDKLPSRTRIRVGVLTTVDEFRFDAEQNVYWHIIFLTSQDIWKLVKMLSRFRDYVVLYGDEVVRKLVSGEGR